MSKHRVFFYNFSLLILVCLTPKIEIWLILCNPTCLGIFIHGKKILVKHESTSIFFLIDQMHYSTHYIGYWGSFRMFLFRFQTPSMLCFWSLGNMLTPSTPHKHALQCAPPMHASCMLHASSKHATFTLQF